MENDLTNWGMQQSQVVQRRVRDQGMAGGRSSAPQLGLISSQLGLISGLIYSAVLMFLKPQSKDLPWSTVDPQHQAAR